MSLQTLQPDSPDGRIHRFQIAMTVNELLKGRANNVGEVTLAASATSTTKSDERIQSTMKVFLSPTSANAAAAMTNVYVSDVSDGSFTLTHTSTSTTDRTFDYVFHGG